MEPKEIKRLLKSGNWMLRMSNDGIGYGGFKWVPIGEWTECPKWTDRPTCDSGGLFGQSPLASGYCNEGTRLELCETDGPQIIVGNNKIKVPKAMIVAVDGDIPAQFYRLKNLVLKLNRHPGFLLPDGLKVGGGLDLERCTGLTSLPDGLEVGGYLYLGGCTGLTSLPDGLEVGGYLYLGGCTGLTSLPDGLKVGGYLYLGGCTGLTSLPDGLKVGGYLYLEGCTGLTSLPDGLKVGGYLYLEGCTGLTSLPDGLKVGGYLYLPTHLKK